MIKDIPENQELSLFNFNSSELENILLFLFKKELIIINGERDRIINRVNLALLLHLGLDVPLLDWLGLFSLLSSIHIGGSDYILPESKLLNRLLNIIFAVFFAKDREQFLFEKRAVFLYDQSEHVQAHFFRLIVVHQKSGQTQF